MDYEEESVSFIKAAFDLIKKYKSQTSHQSGYVGYFLGIDLSENYFLKITKTVIGFISLMGLELGVNKAIKALKNNSI